jgi:hypothetical protein
MYQARLISRPRRIEASATGRAPDQAHLKAPSGVECVPPGRSQRPVEFVGVVQRDAFRQNCRPETGRLLAWIAARFGRLGQRRAVRLRDILSRDSATRSRQHRFGRSGRHLHSPNSRCCGDAFRTGLPRLFKNVDPFRKPEASGKPCAVRSNSVLAAASPV